MSSFLDRLFKGGREGKDVEKRVLEAELSFLTSKFDEYLAQRLFEKDRNDLLQKAYIKFLKQMSVLDAHTIWPISNELQLLESYIDLYKSTLDEAVHVKLTLHSETDEKIPALLLFPLIANAIHMGYNSIEESPLKVKITAFDKVLTMELSNRVNHYIQSQEDTISVQRFKQRVKLMFDEDDYTLFFNSNSRTFKTFLQLKFNR
ncbi:hypothetical protein ORI89_16365 [Sphingobacterium sp. UT-1RO-CII-1]|uniref:hypothetical protein n=1 Tax=Sphingobacterium sp. UT-1RO-CII-1 TaxID=2995225 RepID=UPI00227BA30B|nr:hypothetical protein [Sphingobacterium sp. UT-1RO-CII-1]MCY4781235.1 hypothetical protein [Sphingobacterium sp. UT-1RO-CII-1]